VSTCGSTRCSITFRDRLDRRRRRGRRRTLPPLLAGQDAARRQRIARSTRSSGGRAVAIGERPPNSCTRTAGSGGRQKIGKSLGNAVDAFSLAERFGADAVRYFLLREAPFAAISPIPRTRSRSATTPSSATTSAISFEERSRCSPNTATAWFPNRTTRASRIRIALHSAFRARARHLLQLDFREALTATWNSFTALNRRIEDEEAMDVGQIRERAGRRGVASAHVRSVRRLRWLAMLLHPVMPERTAEIWRQLDSRRRSTATGSGAAVGRFESAP